MAGPSLRLSEIDREIHSDFDDLSSSESGSAFGDDSNIENEESDSDEDALDTEMPPVGPVSHQPFVPQPWSSTISYTEPRLFTEDYGVHHCLSSCCDEIDYFNLLVGGDTFYDIIVSNTNNHASYIQRVRQTIDKEWEPVNKEEIKAFLGIAVYMGIYDLPSVQDYFFSEFVDCKIVRQAMTLKRYKKINQYFHISDIENEPKRGSTDFKPLYKVENILEIINSFKKFYKPGCELSVDEAMIAFKGRLYFKQYMPKKPTKWGLKVWSIACSKSGYVLGGEVYLGKKSKKNEGLLLGEQTVINLTEPFWGKQHHVYFDNFFSSVRLCNLLLEKETYCCGTARTDRVGWPKDFKNTKTLKLLRGQQKTLQCENVISTVWRDNRDVRFLSTNSNPNKITKILRKTGNGRENIEVDCPEVVVKYTKNMGGVDKADQYRSYYGVGRTSKKWWKYLFYFVTNVAVVNAFILRKLSNQPEKNKHGYNQLEFRQKLIGQLIGNFTSRKIVGRKRNLPCGIESPKSKQKIIKTDLRRICKLCSSLNKKTTKNCGIKTPWKCAQCDIYLCKVQCFLEYHSQRGVEISQ